MPLEPNKSILTLVGVISSLSLIAESLALCFFFKNKQSFHAKAIRLIIALIITDTIGTFADFGYFFTYLWEPACIANGYIRQASSLSSFMWIICMCHLIANVLNPREKRFKTYLFLSIVIPSLVSFGILLGNLTGWYHGFYFQVVTCVPSVKTALAVEIPCLMMFLSLFYEYFQVKKLMIHIEMKQQADKFMMYPLTIFLLWSTSLPARIYQLIDTPGDGPGLPILDILFVIGTKSFGLVNSLFFWLHSREKKINSVGPARSESFDYLDRQLSAETEFQLKNSIL